MKNKACDCVPGLVWARGIVPCCLKEADRLYGILARRRESVRLANGAMPQGIEYENLLKDIAALASVRLELSGIRVNPVSIPGTYWSKVAK